MYVEHCSIAKTNNHCTHSFGSAVLQLLHDRNQQPLWPKLVPKCQFAKPLFVLDTNQYTTKYVIRSTLLTVNITYNKLVTQIVSFRI